MGSVGQSKPLLVPYTWSAMNEVLQEEAPTICEQMGSEPVRKQGLLHPELGLRFRHPLQKSLRFTPHCCFPGGQGKEFVLSRLKSSLPPTHPHPTDSSLSYLPSGFSSRVLLPWSWGHTADFCPTTKLCCYLRSFQGRNYI